MKLTSGVTLANYRITASLGAGGMGEVWRAEDSKLGRRVALKVLPEDFDDDADRHARFEYEAKVLASLNHPNIATLFGLEHLDGQHVLVMELVDGEGLDEVIARGPIGTDAAIPLAIQIAEALEAAHEAGIVHRDLKPANIMVTENGIVKVLDFGLAKSWESDGGDSSLSLSPTMTRNATLEGVILGTAAYMSPEQARGKKVDRRADIWAFGVVLWEMLTGEKLFAGDTVSDVMAAVLTKKPDTADLPNSTPVSVRLLVGRCLESDVKRRLQAIGEARIALADTSMALPTAVTDDERIRSAGYGRSALWTAAILATAAVVAGVGWWRTAVSVTTEALPNWTFSQITHLPGLEIQPSLSPDGTYVVYASIIDGDWDIYLLRIGGDNPMNLTAEHEGTDRSPVFSPDGQQIAFQSDRHEGGLFVMGATGESVRRVTDFGFNPSWSPQGDRLVFGDEAVDFRPQSRVTVGSLFLVDLATGETQEVEMDQDAVQPAWSPKGDWIAFWGLAGTAGQRDLWLVRPDGSDLKTVTSDPALDWNPSWSRDGSTLYFSSDRGGTLGPWSVEINPETGVTTGVPKSLTVPSTWAADINVSPDGKTILFTNADFRSNAYRIDFDPATSQVLGDPVPITRGGSRYNQLDPSPDGQWVAAFTEGSAESITLIRADGSSIRRLTDDQFHNRGPVWSPDGSRLVFYSDRSGSYQVHSIRPDGSGLKQLTDLEGGAVLPRFSPDGRRLFLSDLSTTAMIIDSESDVPISVPEILQPMTDLSILQPASWTADGKGLVFVGGEGDTSTRTIYVLDLESKAYRLASQDNVEQDTHYGLPDVLSDGKSMILSNQGVLTLLDFETGRSQAILKPPQGSRYTSPRMGPDDRSIYFLRTESEADLWVARMNDEE